MNQELMTFAKLEGYPSGLLQQDIAKIKVKDKMDMADISKRMSRIMFDCFDLARKADSRGNPLFPWETDYLKGKGTDRWTPELVRSSPGSYELATEWIASSLFPLPLLDRIEKLEDEPKEKIHHQLFREELLTASRNYIDWLPAKMGKDAFMMMLYTFAGGFPEIMPLVAGLGAIASSASAIVEAGAYDTSNQFRRIALIYGAKLNNFVTSHSSELADYYIGKQPSTILQENVNGALTQMEEINASINLVGSIIGLIQGAACGSSIHRGISFTQAGVGAGIALVANRLFNANQRNVSSLYQDGMQRCEMAIQAYVRALDNRDPRAIDFGRKAYGESGNLTATLHGTNQTGHLASELLPWVIALATSIGDRSASILHSGSLLIGQLLAKIALDRGRCQVRLNQSRNQSAYNNALLDRAIGHLEERRLERGQKPKQILDLNRGISPGLITFKYGERSRTIDLTGITFRSGINIILGRTGSGKSTCLSKIEEMCQGLVVAGSKVGNTPADYLGLNLIIRLQDGKANGFIDFVNQELTEDPATAAALLTPQMIDHWSESYTKGFTGPEIQMLDALALKYFRTFVPDMRIGLLRSTTKGASTGEGNRFGNALALSDTKAQVLLLDEPTASLDVDESAQLIIQRIHEYTQKNPNAIIVIATHDSSVTRYFCRTECVRHLRNVVNITTGQRWLIPNEYSSTRQALQARAESPRTAMSFESILMQLEQVASAVAENPDADQDKMICGLLDNSLIHVKGPMSYDWRKMVLNEYEILRSLFTTLVSRSPSWRNLLAGDFDSLSQEILLRKFYILRCLDRICQYANRDHSIRGGEGSLAVFKPIDLYRRREPIIDNLSYGQPFAEKLSQMTSLYSEVEKLFLKPELRSFILDRFNDQNGYLKLSLSFVAQDILWMLEKKGSDYRRSPVTVVSEFQRLYLKNVTTVDRFQNVIRNILLAMSIQNLVWGGDIQDSTDLEHREFDAFVTQRMAEGLEREFIADFRTMVDQGVFGERTSPEVNWLIQRMMENAPDGLIQLLIAIDTVVNQQAMQI